MLAEARASVQRSPVRWFFRLAFAITWGVGGIGLLVTSGRGGMRPGDGWAMVAGYGPSIAGVVCTVMLGGVPAVRTLLRRLVPTRASLRWYPVLLVAYPLAVTLTAWAFAPESRRTLAWWPLFTHQIPAYALTALSRDTGPMGEELGWRGYALPRLLTRLSPLRAALLLGTVWAFWHAPTFFVASLPQHELSVPVFVLNTLALSVLMTRLHQRTNAALDVMLLLHGLANCLAGLVPLPVLAVVHGAGALLLRDPQRRVEAELQHRHD